jgi:signal transduction histidine kinase
VKEKNKDSAMKTHSTSAAAIKQERTLLIFLVVAGYIITFITASWGTAKYSAPQIVIGVLFGVVYMIMGVFDTEILRPIPAEWWNVLYFSIQISLVFGIGWTLGPGGTWLIGLPLASVAVERLTAIWRWPVYIGLLAAIILPIPRYSTWETAWMNAIIISTGIFFVVITSQLRLNEQRARQKAERLTHDLEAANRQLAEYASQAEELAATQERNRLARDIHDNLGHYLTIVNVQIEAARLTLDSDPARAMDALTKVQELARKGLASVRESVAALRVSPVENRPLEEAIAELVNESQTAGIMTELHLVGDSRPVEPKSALAFYRAAQEGLTNIRRHAKASHADVSLDFSQPGRIRLTVLDNGAGAADTRGGFGLTGIRERVQLLGGEFKVETQIGRGFRLEVSIPVAENP